MKACELGERHTFKEAFADKVQSFYSLSENVQQPWLTLAAVSRNIPKAGDVLMPHEDVRGLLVDGGKSGKHRSEDVISGGVLMTWNGSWLQDHEELQLLCKSLRQTPDALSAAARDVPEVQSLLEEFWQQLRKEQKRLAWAQLSVCIEFSLNAEVKTRVHLHAFAEFSLRARVFPAGKATFQDCPCSHLSPSMGRKGPKGRDRAVREGHYYVQAPKLGHIDWRSTCPKFQVMMVNIDFVKRLWMSRKMSYDCAMAEGIKTRNNVPFFVQMLNKSRALEYSMDVEELTASAEKTWESKPFKDATSEEVAFLAQFCCRYTEANLVHSWAATVCANSCLASSLSLRRFKVLILDGLSRTGKTERAANFFGISNCLIVNCQSVVSPNLRPIMKGCYSAVIYDEADWMLMSVNRALFQSSPRGIQLSQSTCNEAAYTVVVWRIPMILTSNNFWAKCQDESARDWILANSYYRWIDEPTWIDEPDATVS